MVCNGTVINIGITSSVLHPYDVQNPEHFYYIFRIVEKLELSSDQYNIVD